VTRLRQGASRPRNRGASPESLPPLRPKSSSTSSEHDQLSARVLDVSADAQEVLAAASLHRHGDLRWIDHIYQRIRRCALHLHHLLRVGGEAERVVDDFNLRFASRHAIDREEFRGHRSVCLKGGKRVSKIASFGADGLNFRWNLIFWIPLASIAFQLNGHVICAFFFRKDLRQPSHRARS
jgi:hypothetical protein